MWSSRVEGCLRADTCLFILVRPHTRAYWPCRTVHVCVRAGACVFLCICACLCTCVCISVCVRVRACVFVRVCLFTWRAYVHACVRCEPQAEAARVALEPMDPVERLLADMAALAEGLSQPEDEPHKGWPPVFLTSKVQAQQKQTKQTKNRRLDPRSFGRVVFCRSSA